jgi:ATP-dependent helicase/nuclease subunit B
MADSAPRLYTIPASVPFLPTLAHALLDGRLVPGYAPRHDPLTLADATVYLPNRRAKRAFGFALLDALGGEATLLPRILPLGDIDEEALAFSEEADTEEILPAIDPLRRRLVLSKLVLQWTRQLTFATGSADPLIAATPAAALALADQLAHLFDDITLANIPFETIGTAVPPNLDQYWEISRQFLEIAHQGWSAYLREQNLLDPAVRRDKLLAREAERLAKTGTGPVIAAGSTGSLPAVANMLSVIARLQNGAVVLPALDQNLDDESFDAIDGGKSAGGGEFDASPGHPQFGLKRLLARIGAKRTDVVSLAEPQRPHREKILSEAFRPAATTDRWQSRMKAIASVDPLADVTFLEATEPREEALAIALALRETLESKGATAALVTPDRALARRVAAELTRWNVAVDDSAGVPLAETEAGRFARLVATVAAEELAPIPLLAFLRHPLSPFAAEAEAIDALEQAILRGPRPAPGAESLARAVEDRRKLEFHPQDPRARLHRDDWDRAAKLAERIGATLVPLTALAQNRSPLARLIEAHGQALASNGLDLAGSAREDTKTLAEVLEKLGAAASDAFDLSLADYADLFAELIADPPVRPPFDPLARIRILGPLEARLISVDRAIVGGLNEGTWPPEARTDAFINRPMRRELGLDLPERRIGLSAHDLSQVMGAREVVLTRARRQAGAETVASRFWQRIVAVASGDSWVDACNRGATLIDFARALDRPKEKPKPAAKPAPRPSRAARPKRLSVTEIGDFVRDPYTIYARHVLALIPLDEIDADPGAAERGNVVHEALAAFARAYPEKMPADAVAKLLAFGREAFQAYVDFPGTSAVWWSRFERIARWFAGEESLRRQRITKTLAEIRGKIEFPIEGEPFTLAARADRVDLFADGTVGVLDYKTGAAPGLKEMRVGLAPQLPLEAAIVRAGGFSAVPTGTSVSEIAVMRLSGGNPAGEIRPFTPDSASKTSAKGNSFKSCDELADFNLARLKVLLAAFAKDEQPYYSIPRPKWRLRYGKYDHLARIAEWSAGAGGDE